MDIQMNNVFYPNAEFLRKLKILLSNFTKFYEEYNSAASPSVFWVSF